MMATNDSSSNTFDIANPDLQNFLHEDLNLKDVGELQFILKESSEIDMTLAYSSEKLANLENLLLVILSREDGIGAIDIGNDEISAELIEKTFTFDLLYAILNFELVEMDNLMGDLQDLIFDALRKVSSCGESVELINELVSKLHNSEELLKQTQERILEMKIQLAKSQMASFSFKPNDWKYDVIMGVKEEFQLASEEWKPQFERKRTLRMLEKSLAGEIELEKKLTEFRQNEIDLKLKIRLTEQVAICMEETAEVAWGRFLEADNTAEVFMGISKETLEKLQVVQFDLSRSIAREKETKSKIQHCLNQLNVKEISIQELNTRVKVLTADNAEVTNLRENIRILKDKVKETESLLKEANESNELSQSQIQEMEEKIESQKESIYVAETRAGNAEEKITHLTDSNLELTEELDFIKGSNDSNAKKVSLLEKQLRELDIQFQHSKALSEASQENQKMLYTAIWDMETLLDDLRQKVAKGESKNESTEERCVLLSERNMELNKEVDFLRSQMEFMDITLKRVSLEKNASAKDVKVRTGVIMDMVVELAMERERIHKQLNSLAKENKLLREKLRKDKKGVSVSLLENMSCNNKEESVLSRIDSAYFESAKTSVVMTHKKRSENSQLGNSSKDVLLDQNESGSSSPANDRTDSVQNPEDEIPIETGNPNRSYMFISVLVVLLSILAAFLFREKLDIFKYVES